LAADGNAGRGERRAPNRRLRPRAMFEAAWKQAECNQQIDMALNNFALS
jgi:hypothetical protein